MVVGAHAADLGRRQLALNAGWRFHFGETTGASRADFDDRDWGSVSVPHTWNAADATQRDFRRGLGWYRLHLVAPATTPGERVYLEFRGVCLTATVWLNGVRIGTHENGFSVFRFDVTETLHAGDNILTVCADTSWRDDIPPREGDFTLCGGIYRGVGFLITPAVAIEPLDHASSGVYLSTPAVSAEQATLRARVLVRNSLDHSQPVTVRLSLTDASGGKVGEIACPHIAPPGSSEAKLELTVTRPHRWHGRRDPYLYTAIASVESGADERVNVDVVRQTVGFRTFRIDAEQGFFLNDEPYDLHGVNLHQDHANGAWAVSAADREADFRMMAELGCTFVRLVHYQHEELDYDLADRFGIVVWTEHALVNTVSASPAFAERCALQVRELVRQNFNHPAIVFWGIGNEVQTNRPTAKPLLEVLAREVRLEDPSRMSTLATNYAEPAGAYGLDTVAHNQYQGWYHHTPEEFAPWLDRQRAKTPGQSIGVSEYGAGAGAWTHRAEPVRMDHSEEYQAYYHEVCWRALRDRPWVWCKAVWDMFDFASAGRKEGEEPGINDKGLVTRDRATRKDAFFWYQANWTDAPMAHITGRRFTPRTSAVDEMKIYSNCSTVELLVNGHSLGVHPVEDHVAHWPRVTLEAGENRIEAVGHHGGEVVRDSCTITLLAPSS